MHSSNGIYRNIQAGYAAGVKATGRNLKRLIAEMKPPPTQVEFAAAMGVGQSLISKWLSGKVTPTTAQLIRLASYLSVTVNDLVEGANNEDGKPGSDLSDHSHNVDSSASEHRATTPILPLPTAEPGRKDSVRSTPGSRYGNRSVPPTSDVILERLDAIATELASVGPLSRLVAQLEQASADLRAASDAVAERIAGFVVAPDPQQAHAADAVKAPEPKLSRKHDRQNAGKGRRQPK